MTSSRRRNAINEQAIILEKNKWTIITWSLASLFIILLICNISFVLLTSESKEIIASAKKEAQKECEILIKETEKRNNALISRTKRQCDLLLEETENMAKIIEEEGKKAAILIIEDANIKGDSIVESKIKEANAFIDEANKKAKSITDEADKKAKSTINNASITAKATIAEANKTAKQIVAQNAKVIITSKVINIPVDEFMLLASVVEAESGNQSLDGRAAVCATIINRINNPDFKVNTISETVKRKGQFTVVSNGFYKTVKISDLTLRAIEYCLRGNDPSKGALYFYNPKYSEENAKRWFETKDKTTVIGDHTFVK